MGKITPLTTFLLIYLMKSNNFLLTKSIKKTKIPKKIFGTLVDEDRVKAKIPLQQVSITLLSKKKKIPPILNISFLKEKAITLAIIQKKIAKWLVFVLAISILVTAARKETTENMRTSKISTNDQNG